MARKNSKNMLFFQTTSYWQSPSKIETYMFILLVICCCFFLFVISNFVHTLKYLFFAYNLNLAYISMLHTCKFLNEYFIICIYLLLFLFPKIKFNQFWNNLFFRFILLGSINYFLLKFFERSNWIHTSTANFHHSSRCKKIRYS